MIGHAQSRCCEKCAQVGPMGYECVNTLCPCHKPSEQVDGWRERLNKLMSKPIFPINRHTCEGWNDLGDELEGYTSIDLPAEHELVSFVAQLQAEERAKVRREVELEKDFEKLLPEHKASLHITHNQHKSYYTPIEEYIRDTKMLEFGSEEDKKASIESDSLWEIQWYPDTPVGFCMASGSTLTAALKVIRGNKE